MCLEGLTHHCGTCTASFLRCTESRGKCWVLFMGEDAKEHQVMRFCLMLLRTDLTAFVPGVGPPAKTGDRHQWKRFPSLLSSLCECSAPVPSPWWLYQLLLAVSTCGNFHLLLLTWALMFVLLAQKCAQLTLYLFEQPDHVVPWVLQRRLSQLLFSERLGVSCGDDTFCCLHINLVCMMLNLGYNVLGLQHQPKAECRRWMVVWERKSGSQVWLLTGVGIRQ